MNNAFGKILDYLVLPVFIIFLSYGVLTSIGYTLTKMETSGTITNIKDGNERKITIEYFNEYKNLKCVRSIMVGHKTGEALIVGNILGISYQKFDNRIYVKDYKNPPTSFEFLVYLVPLLLLLSYLIIPIRRKLIRSKVNKQD